MTTTANVASTVTTTTSGEMILRRLEQMKTNRQGLETILRECYDNTYPLRGSGFYIPAGSSPGGVANQSLSNIKQAELLDSTGTESARILASALMSGLFPASSRWAESWVEEASEADRVWLDDGSTTVWEWITRSNFDSSMFECMLDFVVAGMFYLYIDELAEEEGGGFFFEQWALSSTWSSSSRPGGILDTFYREMFWTAEQAINYYGEENVSKTVVDAAKTAPDKTFSFVWAIYPRPGKNGKFATTMPYASCHVERESKKIIRERGYHECPIVAPRWQRIPGSDNATGPVFEALPTIKQLQQVIRLNIAGLEMNVGGMWIAKDDGVLNPHTVKVGPRKIIVAADTDAMKPLINAVDQSKTILEIQRLQKQIRQAMMADHLDPPDRPGDQQTAYEVHVRVDLIRQLLGPTYGRTQSEGAAPLWRRCWGLAYRAGELGPAPPDLQGKPYTVKYVSPLARAQRGTDLAAMDRYEASLLSETQLDPNVLDNYDTDEASRMRAELGGVPAKLMVKKEDVEKKRAQAAQDQQQQKSEQFSQEALMQHIKGGGDNGNALAMAALAGAMNKPKDFKMKGRQIVGIQ